MSTSGNTNATLTDFLHAVEKLELDSSNWVMFQHRFLIAIRQKKVYAQFDGTSLRPKVLASVTAKGSTKDPTTEQVKLLQAWQDKEDLAMYLLTQKLLDSIFAKYMQKKTVAEIWSAIVIEFMRKSMLMHLWLCVMRRGQSPF